MKSNSILFLNDLSQLKLPLLSTMSDNFYPATSDFWGSFRTPLPTLKSLISFDDSGMPQGLKFGGGARNKGSAKIKGGGARPSCPPLVPTSDIPVITAEMLPLGFQIRVGKQ